MPRHRRTIRGLSARLNGQRGLAALEFAWVALALLGCLYLIATFGAVLYTQQVISRAATDGALVISSASRSFNESAVVDVVEKSLARSLIAPVGTADYAERLAWVRAEVGIEIEKPANGTAIVLSIAYPYAANAILPSLPFFQMINPPELTASATVTLAQ